MSGSEHMNVAAEYRFYGFTGYYYGEVGFRYMNAKRSQPAGCERLFYIP